MPYDVGRYYLDHLHATAGAPELLLRALERAIADLDAGRTEAFSERLSRLRKSLRLERGHRATSAAMVRHFTMSARAARAGDHNQAKAELQPLLDACARALPGRLATAA